MYSSQLVTVALTTQSLENQLEIKEEEEEEEEEDEEEEEEEEKTKGKGRKRMLCITRNFAQHPSLFLPSPSLSIPLLSNQLLLLNPALVSSSISLASYKKKGKGMEEKGLSWRSKLKCFRLSTPSFLPCLAVFLLQIWDSTRNRSVCLSLSLYRLYNSFLPLSSPPSFPFPPLDVMNNA